MNDQKPQKDKGGGQWTGKGASAANGKWDRPAPYWNNKGDKGPAGAKGPKGGKGDK